MRFVVAAAILLPALVLAQGSLEPSAGTVTGSVTTPDGSIPVVLFFEPVGGDSRTVIDNATGYWGNELNQLLGFTVQLAQREYSLKTLLPDGWVVTSISADGKNLPSNLLKVGKEPLLLNIIVGRRSTPVPSLESAQIHGEVLQANCLSCAQPLYPDLPEFAKATTDVVRVTAVIGKDGRVRNATVVGGPALLHERAADAVRTWIYKPEIINGEPVEITATLAVRFGH